MEMFPLFSAMRFDAGWKPQHLNSILRMCFEPITAVLLGIKACSPVGGPLHPGILGLSALHSAKERVNINPAASACKFC